MQILTSRAPKLSSSLDFNLQQNKIPMKIEDVIKLDDYSDVDLEKIAAENMSETDNFTYKGKKCISYNKHAEETFHRKIDFLITNDSGLKILTVKKVCEEEDRHEIRVIQAINSTSDLLFKTNFIRSVYVHNKVFMDYFGYDLHGFIKYHGVYGPGCSKILEITLKALHRLRQMNLCFTDIKTDQILIRPYIESRGSYYNQCKYVVDGKEVVHEVAITDVDMSYCNRRGFLKTFSLPTNLNISEQDRTEKQFLWSVGILCLEMFRVSPSFNYFGENINYTREDFNETVKIINSSNMPEVYKKIAINCFDPKKIKWMDSVASLIDLKDRPQSRRG